MIMCEDENITSSFLSKFDNYFFNKFTNFSILMRTCNIKQNVLSRICHLSEHRTSFQTLCRYVNCLADLDVAKIIRTLTLRLQQ